jgi:hypothetical protein
MSLISTGPHSNNRNAKVLESFAAYCEEHPEFRFWQALRNWVGFNYVLVSDSHQNLRDTFYWEGERE